MLIVFLCLTKPAFMRRPWRITPCPAIHGWAFLCFMCIILQYLNSFASRLHEGVPPAAFPVSRFSYAVTGFSFVYTLTLQQSKIIKDICKMHILLQNYLIYLIITHKTVRRIILSSLIYCLYISSN